MSQAENLTTLVTITGALNTRWGQVWPMPAQGGACVRELLAGRGNAASPELVPGGECISRICRSIRRRSPLSAGPRGVAGERPDAAALRCFADIVGVQKTHYRLAS